jgi:hypothetical protein
VCGHEIRILVCLVEGVLSRLVICIIICRRFDNAKGVLLRSAKGKRECNCSYNLLGNLCDAD